MAHDQESFDNQVLAPVVDEAELILETQEDRRLAPSSLTSGIAPDSDVAATMSGLDWDWDEDLAEEIAQIPDKMAYKIGEVAEIADLKPYVLRYWETEFKQLKPKKSKQNQRVFERRDVAMVLMIKKLLYKDKFSIAGARTALKRLKKENKKVTAIRNTTEQLEATRDQIEDLLLDITRVKALFN